MRGTNRFAAARRFGWRGVLFWFFGLFVCLLLTFGHVITFAFDSTAVYARGHAAHSCCAVFLSIFVSIPIAIPETEVEVTAIRAQGPGGQNVNKVSSAIQLRFDIPKSSLPEAVKTRLLALPDSRITLEGVLVLKAQRYRTQDMNRMDAFSRLHEVVNSVALPPKKRKPTKPSYGSVQKRLESKNKRSDLKSNRGAKGLD